jgi:T-complex protein 1 subunit delta
MTVLLRGLNNLVLAEANRLIHDAQCIVRLLVKRRHLITGGSTAETEASLHLCELTMETSGMDMMELRKAHTEGNFGAGIDVKDGCISSTYTKNVIQQLLVMTSAIKLATATVHMILKVRRRGSAGRW